MSHIPSSRICGSAQHLFSLLLPSRIVTSSQIRGFTVYSNEVDFVELYEMVGKYHPEAYEAQKSNFPPVVFESALEPT